LVRFSGTLTGIGGSPLSGIVGVIFAAYSEQSGGAPLWLETQNVQVDKNGHYSVVLGSTKPEGLPVDLFVSEQARWLGGQGQAEQPRVMLVSAPYALKALDADTLGG
jgi:trimeric autotransporter adhesin